MKKKVKFPKKVDIGGLWFSIIYVKEIPEAVKKELGGNCVAYCDWSNRAIMITRGVAEVDDVTLLHEILHAIIESVSGRDAHHQEWFVKSMSQLIYGAILSLGRPLR
jgi:hypothetical protein